MNKMYEEVGGSTWGGAALGKKPVYRIAAMRRQGEKFHREEGPAYTQHRDDGSLWRDLWYRDGLKHRDDGPAWVLYWKGKVFPGNTRTFEELEKDYLVYTRSWHLNGKEIQKFAWKKRMKS